MYFTLAIAANIYTIDGDGVSTSSQEHEYVLAVFKHSSMQPKYALANCRFEDQSPLLCHFVEIEQTSCTTH
jgi:hypothetical protein